MRELQDMTTLIMLFILPIGIIVYFWDRKNYAGNIKEFNTHVINILNLELDSSKKMEIIYKMFYQNGYTLADRTETTLIVEKKHLNIGVPFILFGLLAYIGIVVYLTYYYYFLKPRRLKIDSENEPFLVELRSKNS